MAPWSLIPRLQSLQILRTGQGETGVAHQNHHTFHRAAMNGIAFGGAGGIAKGDPSALAFAQSGLGPLVGRIKIGINARHIGNGRTIGCVQARIRSLIIVRGALRHVNLGLRIGAVDRLGGCAIGQSDHGKGEKSGACHGFGPMLRCLARHCHAMTLEI